MKKLLLAAVVSALLFSSALSTPTEAQVRPGWVEIFIELPTRATPMDESLINSAGGDTRWRFVTSNTIAVVVPEQIVPFLQRIARFNIRPVPQAEALSCPSGGECLDWGADRINAEHVWGGAEDATSVVNGGNGGAGVRVAVIDTGLDRDHPDLAANIAGGWNFINNSSNYEDDNGHGTHVAGTIAAADNGVGMVGIAPKARLYGLKVLNSGGSGSFADIVAAIEWATGLNGGTKVDIINMSLGCYYQPMPSACDDPALRQAVNAAYAAGVLVVAAAGNSGSGSDTVGYPAQYDSVVAVASTTSSDSRSSFSSTGPDVELAAPGSSIYSTYPNNTYATGSGTSMATPHVAGTAALIKAANPGMSAAQLRTRLRETAQDLGSSGRDTSFGYGLIQADVAAGGGSAPPPTGGDFVSDDFESGGWSGGSGWLNAWSTSGSVSNYSSSGPQSGNRHARLRDDGSITRRFSLSGYSSASLSYWWKGYSWESGDGAAVEISINGSTWTTLAQYNNGQDTNSYRNEVIDLTPWSGNGNVYLRFQGEMSSTSDYFYVDTIAVSGTAGAAADSTPPAVQSTTPVDGAEGVVINGTLWATFDESLDPASVTTATFRLEDAGGSAVGGAVGVSDTMASFTPSAPLAYSTTYTATLTTGITDTAGNAMQSDHSWSFTTEAAPDTTPPQITATTPADGATDVPLTTTISASFDEPIDASTVGGASFSVTGPGGAIPGSYSSDGQTATFTPSSPLAYDTTYTATLSTAIEDVNGNGLASQYAWSFTTVPDSTAPSVTGTTPADNATDVAIDAAVSATFDEEIDASTVGSTSFSLTGPDGAVAGSYSSDGQTVTFTPSSPLAYSTTYSATLTTGISDAAGNALAAAYTWSFTTEAEPDTTRPAVTGTTPEDGATDVALDATISASFDEEIDGSTVTGATFSLSGPDGPVVGSITASGQSATLTPSSTLAYSTTYTATLTTGVEDVAGNALAAAHTWSFTTQAPPPDTTPPAVTGRSPEANATGVDTGTVVTATFDEDVDPASLDGGTFSLLGPAGAVAGSVAGGGTTATFTPSAPLQQGTTYTATLAGITDLAGNALPAPVQWSFTTAAAVEFLDCGSNSAGTSFADGDRNGYEDNPAGACTDGGSVARDVNSGSSSSTSCTSWRRDKHVFYDYDLPIAGGSSVQGIEVRVDARVDSASGSPRICVQLSWNGGASWTQAKQTPVLSSQAETTYILGAPSDTWGRSWSASDLSNANFRVRVIDVASSTSRDFTLDWVAVKVTTGAGGGGSTSLAVDTTSPAPGAVDVPLDTRIEAAFTETLDRDSVDPGSFVVVDESGAQVPGSISFEPQSVVFTPDEPLAPGETYSVTVTMNVVGAEGEQLQDEYGWSFTTAEEAAPPPTSVACAAPNIIDSSDTSSRGGTVTFSWEPVAGATEYTIERSLFGRWSQHALTGETSFSADETWDYDWRVYVSAGECTPLPGPATEFDP